MVLQGRSNTVKDVKVFAHRGGSAAYAEHTRAAFAHALALGVAGVETDIQLSADGHLICWHDATLDRTSSGAGLVRAYRLAELRGLDVHSWQTLDDATPLTAPAVSGGADEQFVTLDQLTRMMLEADREIELAVEMKIVSPSDNVIGAAVLDWLRRWGWDAATGRLCPMGRPVW